MPHEHHRQALAMQERMARDQARAERERARLAEEAKKVTTSLHLQIANIDIHALMDKIDAPRIKLPPEAPALPPMPAAPAPIGPTPPGETKPLDEAEEAETSEPESKDADADAEARPESIVEEKAESKSSEAAEVVVDEPEVVIESDQPAPEKSDAPKTADKETIESANSESAESSEPLRPFWVKQMPKRVGDVQREVIVAGDYQTEDECYRVTDIYLMLATYDHLMRLVGLPTVTRTSRPNITLHYDNILADGEVIVSGGRPNDHRLLRLASAGIGIDYIHHNIARDEHLETVERSVGPMKKLYTLVEFDSKVDAELRAKWNAYRRQERFAVVGFGAASLLGLLGLTWGVLQVDTLTKGYYSKRLFLGVPLGILGLFGLYALLVEMGFDLPH